MTDRYGLKDGLIIDLDHETPLDNNELLLIANKYEKLRLESYQLATAIMRQTETVSKIFKSTI